MQNLYDNMAHTVDLTPSSSEQYTSAIPHAPPSGTRRRPHPGWRSRTQRRADARSLPSGGVWCAVEGAGSRGCRRRGVSRCGAWACSTAKASARSLSDARRRRRAAVIARPRSGRSEHPTLARLRSPLSSRCCPSAGLWPNGVLIISSPPRYRRDRRRLSRRRGMVATRQHPRSLDDSCAAGPLPDLVITTSARNSTEYRSGQHSPWVG